MSRLIAIDIACYFDSRLPPFVEFEGFDSYLSKFGLDCRAAVPVWKLHDLLNPDGSLDLKLIARPAGWTDCMLVYWTGRLAAALENED